MTDEKTYRRRLALLENEEERHRMRKDLYRETYESESFNAREHAEGRKSLEKTQQENNAARKVREMVVDDFGHTDKGKEFLQKEAHEVQQQVQARDVEYRAQKAEKLKSEQAQSVAEAKEKRTAEEVAKLPKGAEVSKREIASEQKDGKQRASEAMAFLAKRQEERKQAPATPVESANEREKRRERERDNEWEP